jgi:hypothetical protein
MDVKEIKKLAKTLRALGINHYEANGVVINLGDVPRRVPRGQKPALVPEPEAKEEIPHIVQELTSVMKMSDADLVDRLFPDTQPEVEADGV